MLSRQKSVCCIRNRSRTAIYCGRFAAVTQTNHSPMGQVQVYSVGGPKVSSEMTVIPGVRRALCGVALSCGTIVPRHRCPGLFLQIASHATSQRVLVGVHVYNCAPTREFSANDSCVLQYRCNNSSSRLTHFECYGCRRS